MFDTTKLKGIIESFHEQLSNISGEITSIKPAEDKWSLREIIGHLIDSASNNHQRFVRLQFGDLLDFPAYEGEEWVRAQEYNSMKWDTLVTLWYNYNCLILHIVENTDEKALANVWTINEDAIPLAQLIKEYYEHLDLHIKHFNERLKELE